MSKKLKNIIPLCIGKALTVLAPFAPKWVAKKAFSIFCTIRKGRVQPEQIEFLEKAKHSVEIIADHSVQTYHWKGEKPLVLLVHGWESNSFRWWKLINALQKENYSIMAFDAPGHGYSSGTKLQVPLYADCVEYLSKKYKATYLIGHSVGGMTILYNEHHRSNPKVEKIVTVGSPSEFLGVMKHFQSVLGFGDNVLRALDRYLHRRFGFHIEDLSTANYVLKNTKKGLIMHDHKDAIVPYAASEAVHANWANSILFSSEGLGHSMHQDEVNSAIVDFLNTN